MSVHGALPARPTLGIAIATDQHGGAEHYLTLLIESLVSRGWDVRVLGRFSVDRNDFVDYEPLAIGKKWSLRTLLASFRNVRRDQEAYLRAIEGGPLDVAHMQFKREQILLSKRVARIAPVVWTEHGMFPRGLFGRAMQALYKRAATHVEVILCVSEPVLVDLRDRIGISPAKLILVENPVDQTQVEAAHTAREATRAGLRLAADDIAIVTLSRLEKPKAVDRIIEARRELPPEFKLYVAGTGSDQQRLETLAESDGSVHFLGFREDAAHVLAAADVFCLPSKSSAREGIPMSLLQAMAAGLPSVVTNDSGLGEWVIGKGGVVTTPDSASLASTVQQAIDQQKRLRLEALSAADAHNMSSWGDVNDEIFVRVLARRAQLL